jgi:hypothetical protein
LNWRRSRWSRPLLVDVGHDFSARLVHKHTHEARLIVAEVAGKKRLPTSGRFSRSPHRGDGGIAVR